jgi:hypothetical protein
MAISTEGVGIDRATDEVHIHHPDGPIIRPPPGPEITVEWGPMELITDGSNARIGDQFLIVGGTATITGTLGVRRITITGASPSAVADE